MILDKQLQLSAAQAVTSSAASQNIIDLGAAGDAYGNELFLVVQVRQAAAATGAATVNFQLQTDSASSFSSPVTLYDSGAIAKTALTLNAEPVKVRIPPGAKRYLRLYYNVDTGPLTAGKFDAFLAPDVKVN